MDLPANPMMAYVFWHWRSDELDSAEYESRQCAFHEALRDAPFPGYRGSFTHGIERVQWAADGAAAYEDWYLIDDYASLGRLNDAAVSASRSAPHDRAASHAAGGTAGLFGLRLGRATLAPTLATWFAKPAGLSYQALFAQLGAEFETFGGGLWMRQMTLGPGTEFCLLGEQHAAPAGMLRVRRVPLRHVWPNDKQQSLG